MKSLLFHALFAKHSMGQVFTASIGSLRREFGMMGDIVNTSARVRHNIASSMTELPFDFFLQGAVST
jgi:hypothetical protein